MELLLWAVVFIASMALLVKSADWLLEGAERIGFAFGLTPFVVGVVIVGLGTSFPEIVSSFAAVLKGATEIVAANAVGSNIANILLIVGI
ncbi:MAG: sodium:calcium antiporter, partial [bacterium]|nr:sodium:calcium antiporter [bacterium]